MHMFIMYVCYKLFKIYVPTSVSIVSNKWYIYNTWTVYDVDVLKVIAMN